VALNYVTLICDLYNGQGTVVGGGFATFTQAAVLTDVPDLEVIVAQPLKVPFGGIMPPQIELLATDNAAPQPGAWSWSVAFQVTGAPAGFSFFLPAGPASFTATHATPAVFTWTPTSALTSLVNGTGVQLSGGSLPGGFTAATTYYVVNSSGFTFELAATQGGSPIASTASGSGELTVTQVNLSTLTSVEPVTAMAGYMPTPGGTPGAGKVPVGTGYGQQSIWEVPNGSTLQPSGNLSGSVDTAAINTALAGADTVLAPGDYYLNAPIIVPAGHRLDGLNADIDDVADYGVTLNLVSAWAQGGAPAAAALIMGDDSAASKLNINVNFIAASLDGIGGGGSNVLLEDINVYGGAINGINQGGLTWRAERVMSNQCEFGITPGSDSDYVDCLASACQDGWRVSNAINTRLIAPRSEWNSRYGYHISGDGTATGGVSLIGPSTDRNASCGVYIDATGNWPIVISGPQFRRDGSDGSSAAIEVAATTTCPVILDGFSVFPGRNDDGTGTHSPVTGIKIDAGATYVAASNGLVHAMTTPVSGTITQVRSVATRTGDWNSPSAITMLPDTGGTFATSIAGLASVTSGVVALSYSAALSINAALGNHFRVTLTGNAAVNAPTNPTDGQKVTIEVIQDATGSRTLTWDPAFDFGSSATPVLTTTGSKRDLIGFVYSGSLSKWLYAGSALGF
jgi:hypothetical protein